MPAPRTFFQTYLSSWSDSFGDLPEVLPAKLSVWDRPGVAADRALLESNLSTPFQLASFRAAASPHSGEWLFALPITSCGLCLDDEGVGIAVSVRLGMAICVPHNCHCRSLVDAHGLHSFVCRKAPGKITRHHALNDLAARAFTSAGIPTSKEPHGLVRSGGKRQDGLRLVP